MTLDALAPFRQTALSFLAINRDRVSIRFSGTCYTIQIPDDGSPDGSWTSTLAFSSIDSLQFASCSCPDGDCCEHLMIAYLVAHDPKGWELLHHKFTRSFWYHLFLKLFLNQEKLYAQGNCTYTLRSPYIDLTLKALSPHAFSSWLHIIHNSPPSTQIAEKYFPSSSLYQMATKFFFFCQQGASLQIEENREGMPACFSLQWEGVYLSMDILDFATLEDLFPKIDFSQSSLAGADTFHITDVRIIPDKARICFHLCPSEKVDPSCVPLSIGNIAYLPTHKKVLLPKKEASLPIDAIALLPESFKHQLLSQFNYCLNETQLHYTLHFFCDASISFSAYLKSPGDLDEASLIYPSYCYIPGRGLITIKGALSQDLRFTIKADQVEEFLNTQGHLIQEPGFMTHTEGSPTGELSYNLTEQNVLLFSYNTGTPLDKELHYGAWTYYPGQGFFLKKKESKDIQDGTTIPAEQIPSFITQNETTLKALPGFFTDLPKIKRIFFDVRKNTQGLILTPVFEGNNHPCRLFGDFIYQDNLGFSHLPAPFQSIDVFPRWVSNEDVLDFISQHANDPRLRFADISLCPPGNLELTVLAITRPHPSSPLHLQLELKTDLGSLPVWEILQALKSKKNFLCSPAGFLNLQGCLFLFFKQFLAEHKHDVNAKTIIATTIDILNLDALAPLITHKNIQASEEDLAFFSRLKATLPPALPRHLFSVDHHLRPYQDIGLSWLWFLYNHGLSGLLCDEMGLGKTHQATAFLDIVFRSSTENPRFLVVCPTSVLPHWEKTLTTHIPSARIFSFHGPNKPETLPPCDIVITSYGTLRQNYVAFYNTTFTISIFDEIHLAKNKTSQIHKILCRLDSQTKLGLTGTPIENNLMEFKGLLDIILPNLYPDHLLKKLFSQKAIQQKDSTQDLLLKFTKPFILRRTKKLVLPELPEKVESIVPCRMSLEQEELYTTILQQEKPQIDQLASNSEPVNYLHVFALLNHLKQICNHPAIFLKQIEAYKEHKSGKWEAFVNLLHESLAAGYKVVVFSQYISMLKIITQYLEELHIQYALIQGKSLNRQEEIDRFSNDPQCKVFVGSLLAAGTGINLTAGNVVILYDRWWNPAKENQALDRVHRIGQKNTVFIYKLMTENSLEERIHYLIEEKVKLLDRVISTQHANILHMLNKEDLITILSYKST